MSYPYRPIGILITVFLLGLPFLIRTDLIDLVSLPRALGGFLFLITAGAVTLFYTLRHPSYRFQLPTSAAWYGAVAWLGFTLLSWLQADQLPEAIWSSTRLVLFIAWMLLVVHWLRTDDTAANTLIRCLGILAWLLILLALVEWWQVGTLSATTKSVYLLNASLEHKNLLASGIFLLLPALFLWWQNKALLVKILGGLGLLLGLTLLLFLQSRAVWLALLVVGGAYFLQKKGSWKMLLPIGVLLLAATFFFQDRLFALWQYRDVQNEHTETIRERLFLWEHTADMIQEQPWTGVGAGQWKLHFPKYGLEHSRAEQGRIIFVRPHQDYLWIWAETGIGGLLAWLLLLGGSLWIAFRHQEEVRLQMAGLAVLGYAVVAFFDFPGERVFHLIVLGSWLSFLLAKQTKPLSKTAGILCLGSLLFVSVLASSFLWHRLQAEQQLKEAIRLRTDGQQLPQLVEQLAKVDQKWYPLDPTATPVLWYIGEANFKAGDLVLSQQAFHAAEKVHPYHLFNLNNLGAVYFQQREIAKAEAYFQKALAIAPHFNEANLNLASLRLQTQGVSQALAVFDQCHPDSSDQRYLSFMQGITNLYIQELGGAKKIDPEVQMMLEKMQSNPNWLLEIHQRAIQYQTPFAERLLEEAAGLAAAEN